MKALFLDHPEADYLSTIAYMGLCEELGADNVVEFPYKPSHHGINHIYPNPNNPVSDGVTSPFAWLTPTFVREWPRQEIIDRIGEFGLFVLASPRKYNVAALRDLIATVGRGRLSPLVMIDGEDAADIRADMIREFTPDAYFKRELIPNPKWFDGGCYVEPLPTRLEPFPFASVVAPQPPATKDIDVLFLGGATWPGRAEACAALKSKLGDRFVGGVGVHYNYPGYLDALNRAKISISFRGHGFDPLRFYEITSFETLLVSDRTPVIKPHPFEDGQHVAYFNDVNHMLEIVTNYLNNESERVRVARGGNVLLREHHTPRARARQLLAFAR